MITEKELTETERRISNYWIRIGKIEERIQDLDNHDMSWNEEMRKRKSLLNNIKSCQAKLKKEQSPGDKK